MAHFSSTVASSAVKRTMRASFFCQGYVTWEEMKLTWSVAEMFAAWKLYLSAVVSPTTPRVSLNLEGKFSCMRMILSRTTE